MWLRHGIGLFVIGLLCGCATGTVSPPTPRPSAFFPAETADRTLLQSLATKLDTIFETCSQQNICEEVYFTRGLLALFEDRDVAAASFREVLKSAPTGPLATPSRYWLGLLSDEASITQELAFAESAKSMAQLWVTRISAHTGVACNTSVEAPQKPDPYLQGLQRRIQTRDRRIAELTDQLRALKQIDQDGTVNRKLRPSRKIQAEK